MLSAEEFERYQRQIRLPDLGQAGQEKLKQASVLVIGAGGLGTPVLQYLVGAGVGHIGLVDFDYVNISNIHRQILFNEDDEGQSKVITATEKLAQQNPHIRIQPIHQRINRDSVLEIIAPFDILVDGSDNFSTKYLLNDAAVITGKTLVSGAIHDFSGQVSVFNWNGGPSYRCLFPDMPEPGSVPTCAEHGVMPTLPAIIGSIQANEVLKIITGIGDPLSGKLWTIDTRSMDVQIIRFERVEANFQISELPDDIDYCDELDDVDEISVEYLNERIQERAPMYLLDVRETSEFEIASLPDSHLVPLEDLEHHINRIPTDTPIYVLCHHGSRSKRAALTLIQNGYPSVKSVAGGIDRWSRVIDSSIPRY